MRSGKIIAKPLSNKQGQNLQRDNSKTEGIESGEIERRKAAGECLHCAWPQDRKGNHRVKDCIRGIKLDKGTATYPTVNESQKGLYKSISSEEE